MSAIWHLARKDIRRMALPGAFLLAIVAGGTLWVRLVSLTPDLAESTVLAVWLEGLRSYGHLLGPMQMLVTWLVAGGIVMEDTVGGTTSFWLTRPIPPGRLLVAKVLVIVILLVLAPLVVLTPIWFSAGFSGIDIAKAAGRVATIQGWGTLVGALAGSMSRSAGQFFGGTILAVVSLSAYEAVSMSLPAVSDDATATWLNRDTATTLGLALIATATIVYQYRTRRTTLSALVLVGSLALLGVVQNVLPPAPSVARWWKDAERVARAAIQHDAKALRLAIANRSAELTFRGERQMHGRAVVQLPLRVDSASSGRGGLRARLVARRLTDDEQVNFLVEERCRETQTDGRMMEMYIVVSPRREDVALLKLSQTQDITLNGLTYRVVHLVQDREFGSAVHWLNDDDAVLAKFEILPVDSIRRDATKEHQP